MDRIEITDTKENKKYYFICKKWLSLHKDDKKIERIIKELVSFNFFFYFFLTYNFFYSLKNYEPENNIKISRQIKRKPSSKSKENENKEKIVKHIDINNHSYLINSRKNYVS